MQKALFLDYLDGSIPLEEDHRFYYRHLMHGIFSKIPFNEYLPSDFPFPKNDICNTELEKITRNVVQDAFPIGKPEDIENFIKEHVFKSHYFLHSTNITEHRRLKGKNYVASKNLKIALENVSLDIPCSLLPEEKSVYIELPDFHTSDGDHIFCSWIYTSKNKNNQRYLVCTSNSEDGWPYFALVLDSKKTIEQVLLEHIRIPKDKPDWRKTLLSALVYINNPSVDIIEKFNEFESKKSKLKAQKKIYTSKPFIPIGHDFEKLRLITGKNFGVRGHFRWQPCGENKSKVKLIFIKPHERTIGKNLGF